MSLGFIVTMLMHALLAAAQDTQTGPKLVTAQPAARARGELRWKVITPDDGALLGAKMLALDDRNGDRIPDFLVGAPAAAYEGFGGAVYLVCGRTGALIARSRLEFQDELRVEFGASIAEIGDVDGDGVRDFVVGGRPFPAAEAQSAVFVLGGSNLRTIKCIRRTDGSAFGSMVSCSRSRPGVGSKVSVLAPFGASPYVEVWDPGLNGPQFRTPIIQTRYPFVGGLASLRGDVDAEPWCLARLSSGGGFLLQCYEPDLGRQVWSQGDTVGRAVVEANLLGVGDCDGDSWDDLVVGSHQLDVEKSRFGVVSIVSGKVGESIASFATSPGEPDADMFGASASVLTRPSGADRWDLAIGWPAREFAGRVRLHGASWAGQGFDVVAPDSRSSFGFGVCAATIGGTLHVLVADRGIEQADSTIRECGLWLVRIAQE